MDSGLQRFGAAQVALAHLIRRRTGNGIQILQLCQPVDESDESLGIDYLHKLIDQAGIGTAYANHLAQAWNGKDGVPMVNATLEERSDAVLMAVAFVKPAKHVIILGAGASASAGFPLANELAALMKNSDALRQLIIAALSASGSSEEEAKAAYQKRIGPFLQRFEEPLKLFKGAGYETIDHFSKEARTGRYARAVQQLKKLIRLILSLPGSRTLEGSDYGRFVAKLIDPASNRCRDDVVVLTFNYDPSLQWLLCERLRCRNEIKEAYSPGDFIIQCSAIAGGLGMWPERSWAERKCPSIIQLHGSIVYPVRLLPGGRYVLSGKVEPAQDILYGKIIPEDIFGQDLLKAVLELCDPELEEPPIAFPFEIFQEDGQIAPAGDFQLSRNGMAGTENLHPLFSFLWNYARQQIESADKISFVGLSLHEFLMPGLNFLFTNKAGPTQMVIANPEVQRFGPHHPDSLHARTVKLLEKATGGKIQCILSAQDTTPIKEPVMASRAGISVWSSFRDFIEREI